MSSGVRPSRVSFYRRAGGEAERALRAQLTGLPVRTIDDVQRTDETDLVIVEDSTFSSEQRLQLLEQIEPSRLLWLTDGQQLTLNKLLREGIALHCIPATSAVELVTTVRKLVSDDIFGIDKYFDVSIRQKNWSVVSSDVIPQLCEEAATFATELGVTTRMTALVCTVFDECLTNAVFNAPTDEKGTFRFASRRRENQVRLEPGEAIDASLTFDGVRLGVAVRDSFGSLTPQRALERLREHATACSQEPASSGGGAGLGLSFIMNSTNQLVINLSPGRRTEVIGVLWVDAGYRNHLTRGRSFNFFVTSPLS